MNSTIGEVVKLITLIESTEKNAASLKHSGASSGKLQRLAKQMTTHNGGTRSRTAPHMHLSKVM